MAPYDLRQLLAVVSEAVDALRMNPRDVEDCLDIGHGTLKRLLDGSTELRVRHLVALAGLLEIHPKELLELGLPGWPTRRRLNDWLPPARRKASTLAPLSDEQIAAVRELVREELALKLEPGAAAPRVAKKSSAARPRRTTPRPSGLRQT